MAFFPELQTIYQTLSVAYARAPNIIITPEIDHDDYTIRIDVNDRALIYLQQRGRGPDAILFITINRRNRRGFFVGKAICMSFANSKKMLSTVFAHIDRSTDVDRITAPRPNLPKNRKRK